MSGTSLAQPGDLPKLIGYKHLFAEYGWPKRTIQDWLKARKFPTPAELPGREKLWHLQDILDWLENRRQGLCSVAISRPEDLEPDQLAEATVALLARSIEHEIGEAVDPRGIRISYGAVPPPVSEEALAKAEAREAMILRERFSEFSPAQSVIMAAWLFPKLRQMFADGAADGCEAVFCDDKQLFALAAQALNEESWVLALAELKALSREGGGSVQ